MSPRSPTTRDDLLRATLELLTSGSYGDLTLGRVASRAGVSRQALYLHFPSKTHLLLALVAWMDENGRLPQLLASAFAHADPVDRLLALVAAGATYTADIADAALALRAAAATDPAARAAWNDRAAGRRDAMRHVVKDVADAGRLAEGFTVRTATDVLFTLLGFTVYEDLVRGSGWTQKRYENFVVLASRQIVIAG